MRAEVNTNITIGMIMLLKSNWVYVRLFVEKMFSVVIK